MSQNTITSEVTSPDTAAFQNQKAAASPDAETQEAAAREFTPQEAFQNLNLSDDFLFAKVMEDETILRPLVEKILRIHIRKMKIVQPQRQLQIEPDSKGIRLDIMADDEEGSLYDVEVQNRKEYNIGRRTVSL